MRLVFASCFFLITFIPPDDPPWLNYHSRNTLFPSDKYLIGFTSRYFHPDEDLNAILNEVKHMSRVEMTESVFLKINSKTELLINQSSTESSISFEKSSVSRTSLDAVGIKTETHLDKENKVAYGISFIEKRKLALFYHKKLITALAEVENDLVYSHEQSQNLDYSALMQLQSKLQYASGLQDLLLFLGVISETALMRAKWRDLKYQVSDQVYLLRNLEGQPIEQLIKYFVEDLIENAPPDFHPLFLKPVSFKNTNISTEFSQYLYEISRQELARNYKILNKPDTKYVLEGSYWPSSDKIQVSLNLHEVDGLENIRLVYGSSLAVSIDQLKELNIEYTPIDMELQRSRFNTMKKDIVVNGGLQATIQTNKGREPLIFKENDTLSFLVNVSRPSYIQIINIWSDGSKLLLLNNYFMDSSKVNENILLPFQWVTTCPCGIEYVKLIAQAIPFDPIATQEKEGLSFITGDIDDLLMDVRQKQLKGNSSNYFGESSIILTTMK